MTEYRSEFETPVYSVLDKRPEGQNVVTRVVMHGEMMEFEISEAVRRSVGALVLKNREEQ